MHALPLYYIVPPGATYQPTNYHTQRPGNLRRPYAGYLIALHGGEATLAPAQGHRYGSTLHGFLGGIIVDAAALLPLYR